MYDFFYVSGSNVLEPESLLHRLKASKSRFYFFFFLRQEESNRIFLILKAFPPAGGNPVAKAL